MVIDCLVDRGSRKIFHDFCLAPFLHFPGGVDSGRLFNLSISEIEIIINRKRRNQQKKDEHLFSLLLLPNCSSRKPELQTILCLLRTSNEAKSEFKKKCNRRGDFSTTSDDTIQPRKLAISTVVPFK